MQGEPFLENLAHAARGLAEFSGGNAGGAVEGADEIGEIAEADVIGDVGDGHSRRPAAAPHAAAASAPDTGAG